MFSSTFLGNLMASCFSDQYSHMLNLNCGCPGFVMHYVYSVPIDRHGRPWRFVKLHIDHLSYLHGAQEMLRVSYYTMIACQTRFQSKLSVKNADPGACANLGLCGCTYSRRP